MTSYLGVTRVRNAEGIFVRNFAPSQIKCRDDVKRELQILRRNKQYTFSKTYLETKIWENTDEIKIGYFNINGLDAHIDDLNMDNNLSNLDFLCVAETKLSSSTSDEKLNSILGMVVELLNLKIFFFQEILI